MASGSEFGKILRLTTWGESHGAGIGAVLEDNRRSQLPEAKRTQLRSGPAFLMERLREHPFLF